MVVKDASQDPRVEFEGTLATRIAKLSENLECIKPKE